MKKTYVAPEAELLTFAKEDVITASPVLDNWNLPSIDLGDWNWADDDTVFKI